MKEGKGRIRRKEVDCCCRFTGLKYVLWILGTPIRLEGLELVPCTDIPWFLASVLVTIYNVGFLSQSVNKNQIQTLSSLNLFPILFPGEILKT